MLLVRDPGEMARLAGTWRGESGTVGFVPTMGDLHEGHLSLMEASREECDRTVASIFVNPTQFGAGEDFDRYPRNEDRDRVLAGEAGVDLLFMPEAGAIYGEGFRTTVEVAGMSDVLCGDPESRGSGHFTGVTTVVAKLLNLVDPDVAFFGQKDAQQAALIRRMASDLDFRTRIAVRPTVREADGLAMSSRNRYLTAGARTRALSLFRALEEVRVALSETDLDGALERGRAVLAEEGLVPEYFEARLSDSLEPAGPDPGEPFFIAIAADVDGTRLIDNVEIDPGGD
jgi:pantoate--beta-alanine ligase